MKRNAVVEIEIYSFMSKPYILFTIKNSVHIVIQIKKK